MKFFKSKTTIYGILTLVSLLTSELVFLFDDIASTNPNYGLIITSILITFGFINAADSTPEQ